MAESSCGLIDEDTDFDGDGWSGCPPLSPGPFDCDDGDPAISPDAAESCDGADEDCDGLTDEGWDADADGVSTCAGDCDDTSAGTWPGAPERCDGLDNDCDGEVDEGWDLDSDGFVTCGGDCDDSDPTVYPGSTEGSDAVDADCDGIGDAGAGCSVSGGSTRPGWLLVALLAVGSGRRLRRRHELTRNSRQVRGPAAAVLGLTLASLSAAGPAIANDWYSEETGLGLSPLHAGDSGPAGDVVDLFNGALWIASTDVYLPGPRGLDLAVTRPDGPRQARRRHVPDADRRR